MRKGVYEISGLIFLIVFLLVFILNLLDGGVTGKIITDFETDFSYCDYNISCGFDNWSEGSVYCLNESQVTEETCFNITNNSVTLDLQGFSIARNERSGGASSGGGDDYYVVSGVYGIYVDGYDGVVVSNGNILNFSIGVLVKSLSLSSFVDLNLFDNAIGAQFDSCSDGNFLNVASFDNSYYSLLLLNSNGFTFSNVFFYGNMWDGIYLYSSDSNLFLNMVVYDNLNDGIFMNNSNSNIFSGGGSYFNSMDGISMRYSNSNSFNSFSSYNNFDGIDIVSSVSNVFADFSSYNNTEKGFSSDTSRNIFYNLNLSGNGNLSVIGVDTISYNESDDEKVEWSINNNVTFSGELDFEKNIDFGNNYVDVNTSALPDIFNSPATITLDLSGTGISLPVPLIDGVICEDDVCDIEDFIDDVIVMTVTHFSKYSFNQSSCGDSYCALGESCSGCAEDCGECSVNDPDLYDDVFSLVNESQNQSVINESLVSDADFGDSGDEMASVGLGEEVGSISWLWILVGIGVVVLLMIIGFVILIVVNRSSSGIVFVSRPSNSSFGAGVGDVGSFSGEDEKASTSESLSEKEAEVKKVFPVSITPAVQKPISVIQKPIPAIQKPIPAIQKPIPAVQKPVFELESVSGSSEVLLPVNIRYIKYYAQNISHDSKVRIKYLIKKGEQFVNAKDYVNAKKIYSLIFEEYKDLEVHDEGLYQKIVSFRKTIPE